jgi:DNA polymerase-3 subunit gamma/tau
MSEYLLHGQTSDALILLNDIIERGFEGKCLSMAWANIFVIFGWLKTRCCFKLLEVSETVANLYITQAQKCSLQFWLKPSISSTNVMPNYRMSLNKRLAIEITLINICQIEKSFYKLQAQPTTRPTHISEPNAEYAPKSSPSAASAPSFSRSLILTSQPNPSLSQLVKLQIFNQHRK